jgi:hypothetical protein
VGRLTRATRFSRPGPGPNAIWLRYRAAPRASCLARLSRETGCVPVIGPSGSGKSAVIAAAAQRLSDAFTCLRIPVAAVGDVAGSPVALG